MDKEARVYSSDHKNASEVADLIAKGGVVAMPFGVGTKRIMILVGCFDNPSSTERLNDIKGRPSRQVLGIGCLAESVHLVAETHQSKPLVSAAKRLLGVDQPTPTHLNQVLDRLTSDNTVGVLLKANKSLPDQVTAQTSDGRTVLILGAKDSKGEYDIYNHTIRILFSRHGKLVAGTSANSHGSAVYSPNNQKELYEELKFKVDGFVMVDDMPKKSLKLDRAASSTTIDLTGERPKVMRWGSQHPLSFKKFFPDLIIPKDVVRETYHESWWDFFRRKYILNK